MINNNNKWKGIIAENLCYGIIILIIIVIFSQCNNKPINNITNNETIKTKNIFYEIEIIYLDGFKDTITIESDKPKVFNINGNNGIYYLKDDFGDVYVYGVIRSKTISTTSNTNN